MFYQNALKLPWRLSMVTCTLHDLSGEDVLDEEAAQVVSSVFSACFPRLFKHFCELWSKRWEWVHESLQSPSIAEGGNAAESQGCALDTVAFRGHTGSTSGQARLETSRHSDPEMQPMKTRYDTIANLHLYGYTVTQYQHRDRQVCKSKTWAQRGKPKRKWNVSGQCLPNGKQS